MPNANSLPIRSGHQIVLVSKGFSQKDLAVQLDKNEHTVSNWRINKSQPHLKDLQRIADLPDLDICDLLVSRKDR